MRETLLGKLIVGGMLVGASVGLSGCEEDATKKAGREFMKTEQKDWAFESEYEIKRVGVFQDDLAYGGKRGIYKIINKETGKEYFGVSGIGITELGSHSDGDDTVPDER